MVGHHGYVPQPLQIVALQGVCLSDLTQLRDTGRWPGPGAQLALDYISCDVVLMLSKSAASFHPDHGQCQRFLIARGTKSAPLVLASRYRDCEKYA